MKITSSLLKVLFVVIWAIGIQTAMSQSLLTGQVINTNHNPIMKAEVLLRDAPTQTILAHRVTDHLGGFSFDVFNPGQYIIEYRRCGYQPMLSKIIEIEKVSDSKTIEKMMLEKALKQRHFIN